jgi:hypothetical protein
MPYRQIASSQLLNALPKINNVSYTSPIDMALEHSSSDKTYKPNLIFAGQAGSLTFEIQVCSPTRKYQQSLKSLPRASL